MELKVLEDCHSPTLGLDFKAGDVVDGDTKVLHDGKEVTLYDLLKNNASFEEVK